MMKQYRIAICDDEVVTCTELEKMTEAIFSEMSLSVEINVFYSAEGLKTYIESGNEFSFILLDIELYEMNGVDLGRYIREEKLDVNTQILYVSSKTMYAMKLFQVQPLDFLVKPVSKKQLKADYEKGLHILGNGLELFRYRMGKEIGQVPTNEIISMESQGRKIQMITTKETVTFYGKLDNIVASLPSCFMKIHRSYLVNLNLVRKFQQNEIILCDGRILPVSRTYQETLRRYLLENIG